MGFSFDKLLMIVGLLALLHAAYSAAQHRSYLRLTEQDFTSLPVDILVQSVVGLYITCHAVIRTLSNFREIRVAGDVEKKTWENFMNRTSFYCFNHRGKKLFGIDQTNYDH